jgi:hypothetical protein
VESKSPLIRPILCTLGGVLALIVGACVADVSDLDNDVGLSQEGLVLSTFTVGGLRFASTRWCLPTARVRRSHLRCLMGGKY